MFTGIVEEVGAVQEAGGHRLVIAARTVLDGLALGDSIAVNGACLTVVHQTPTSFAVDLSQETLDRTNLGRLEPGDEVNLERALLPTSRMGGHIVQGHVDATGVIVELGGPPEARVLRVDAPPRIARYLVEKGFVAVDGISLTITGIVGTTFGVAVIPYTMENTALRSKRPGDLVNLEADILAKYVERLLESAAAGPRDVPAPGGERR